jgi:hypothetical protein
MQAEPLLSAARRVIRGAGVAVLLATLLAGCRGPQMVKGYGDDAGMHLYVRAPARQVLDRLPAALAPAGWELQETYRQGPPLWRMIALLPAGVVGDGQWARIIVKELGPQLCVVRVVTMLRGGGIAVEDPSSTARNILMNVYLVNAAEVQGDALSALRQGALQGGGFQ